MLVCILLVMFFTISKSRYSIEAFFFFLIFVTGTRESRGMTHWDQPHDTGDNVADDEVYSWTFYPRLLRMFPVIRYLPFLPKGGNFQGTKDYKEHTEKMVPS